MAKSKADSRLSNGGKSDKSAGMLVVLSVAGYMLMATAAMIFMLAHLWPASRSIGPGHEGRRLFWAFALGDETRLLLLVALAGAIGAQVNMLRCFSQNVGHGRLKRSWVMSYICGPFVGAVLALAFYFLVRAWFCPAPAGQTSVYGFAALAALVGLFAEPIAAKLKDLANALSGKS